MSRLSEIRRGSTATVRAIDGTRSFRRRLLEMGLVPGTQVKVINVAPLGDPLFIEVRGSQWSLRRNEAAEIQIEAPGTTSDTTAGAAASASGSALPTATARASS